MLENNKVRIFATVAGVCGVDAGSASNLTADGVMALRSAGLKGENTDGVYTQNGLLTRTHYNQLIRNGEALVFTALRAEDVPAKIYNLIGRAAIVMKNLYDDMSSRHNKGIIQQIPQGERAFYQMACIEGLTLGQIYGTKKLASGETMSTVEKCWLMIAEVISRKFLIPLVKQEEWIENIYEPVLPREGRRAGEKTLNFRMPLAHFLAKYSEMPSDMSIEDKLVAMGAAFSEEESNVSYRTAVSDQGELLLLRGASCYMVAAPAGGYCDGMFSNNLVRLDKYKIQDEEDPQSSGEAVLKEERVIPFTLTGARSSLCMTIVLGTPAVVKNDFYGDWRTHVDQATGDYRIVTRLNKNVYLVRTERGDRLEIRE